MVRCIGLIYCSLAVLIMLVAVDSAIMLQPRQGCASVRCPQCTVCQSTFSGLAKCLPRTREPCCPDGRAPVQCFVDPCMFASCPAFRGALCVADYCGGCNARFYNPASGNEVTDECGSAFAQRRSACDRARCPRCTICREVLMDPCPGPGLMRNCKVVPKCINVNSPQCNAV